MIKKPAVSVIITAFKEPRTIGKAIKSILEQIDKKKDQLLVVAPDEETLGVARKFSSPVEVLRDKGKGKPAALNLAFGRVKGEIAVLTDGDIWVEKRAVRALVEKFKNPEVGIISGRPIPANNRKDFFGFWAYLLTETAHYLRVKRIKRNQFIDCSGYLLAIRKNLLSKIPPETLTEDAYLSQKVCQAGFKTSYAPEAKVYVKFPANFRDWLKQKTRSVGGARKQFVPGISKMRGWRQELKGGVFLFSLCKTPKEWLYLLLLFGARFYLWLVIFWKLHLQKSSFETIWQRVESTK